VRVRGTASVRAFERGRQTARESENEKLEKLNYLPSLAYSIF
jgi:hypothetical protein